MLDWMQFSNHHTVHAKFNIMLTHKNVMMRAMARQTIRIPYWSRKKWNWFDCKSTCAAADDSTFDDMVHVDRCVYARIASSLTCGHLFLYLFQLGLQQKLNSSEMAQWLHKLPGKLSIAFSDTLFRMWFVFQLIRIPEILVVHVFVDKVWMEIGREDSFQHYFHLRQMH